MALIVVGMSLKNLEILERRCWVFSPTTVRQELKNIFNNFI